MLAPETRSSTLRSARCTSSGRLRQAQVGRLRISRRPQRLRRGGDPGSLPCRGPRRCGMRRPSCCLRRTAVSGTVMSMKGERPCDSIHSRRAFERRVRHGERHRRTPRECSTARQVDASKSSVAQKHRSLAAVDRGTMPGQHLHFRHRALHQGGAASPPAAAHRPAHPFARCDQHQRTERPNETGIPTTRPVPPRIAGICAHAGMTSLAFER